VLEVGSGPVSLLAGAVDNGLVLVEAVDPLARAYRLLLRQYGIAYPIRPLAGRGEKLPRKLLSRPFDIAYSSNAIDHSRSPRLCLEQMNAAVRPGGFLLLEGFCNEGSEGGWVGLHQHDIRVADGKLVHLDRAGRPSELTTGLPLTYRSYRVTGFRDRGIFSFGYDLPEGMAVASGNWYTRSWYTVLLQKASTAESDV
jgi:hypothetical protein